MFLKHIHPGLEFNVFAANRLPIYVNTPIYLISNLDPDTRPGSHWVAIHINSNGVGEYFDSFGRKPTGYHQLFMQRNSRIWFYNNYQLQNCFTSVCGEYSLVYLYFRFKNISMLNLLNCFSFNTLQNDLLLREMFKSLFRNIVF